MLLHRKVKVMRCRRANSASLIFRGPVPKRHDGAHDVEGFLMPEHLLVSVVDDDESVRESLPDLLRELGFAARAFSSADAFLASGVVGETGCLVLDIAMPGMSGPELRQELIRRQQEIPIVFITAHGDEAVRPLLSPHGVAQCLSKPFTETELLEALKTALQMR
jgi:FixJ family two-component response regulator